MSELPKQRRPAQRVDLGASSGPAPWWDDSALVKALKQQLAASQEEVARLREALVGADWIIKKLAPHEALAIMVRGYRPSYDDVVTGAKYRTLIDAALATSGKDEEVVA